MKKKIFFLSLSLIVIIIIIMMLLRENIVLKMPDFYNKSLEMAEKFFQENNIKYEIKESYSNDVEINKIIWQNKEKNEIINEDDKIIITKSKGKNLIKQYENYNVDESGNVPIMMYHGISNLKNEDTGYIGGNVDKDGYTRTLESFKNDLDFYYQNGYRMIKLDDYINGNINVPLGKSPIILTFDDGLANNMKVISTDINGKIIIDPNSAVGVLEEYKEKYPDFNVTATFFVNGGLFNQSEYNEQILRWLIEHGYDIGNHTYSHVDFTTINSEESINEVGKMYQALNKIIGDRYVNIVALPYGSPYSTEHSNFPYILNGSYADFDYQTKSTLRVGWEAEYSPFNINFNKKFLKRIRAYDNNGYEFDIEMNFKILESNKYISDGDESTVVVPKDKKDKISDEYDKNYIYY